MEMRCESVSGLKAVAEVLLKAHPQERVFAFSGSMGAGKTTFIKVLCETLGVVDEVNSPTFALVNEYRRTDGGAVFHFDFYRINKITEALDIGYELYFYGGDYCLIEWPEKITELLPENCVYVRIQTTDDPDERIFLF